MNEPPAPVASRGILRSLGPAIIVASVVLGPGSILISSKVGCQYGYELIWILAGSTVLMIGMVALSARLGVALEGTPCQELARRVGRPFAAFVGIVLFLIIATFQYSNNLAVVAGLEPLFETGGGPAAGQAPGAGWAVSTVALLAINALTIAVMFGLRRLYKPVEWAMKALVAVMVVGFCANLLFARPSIVEIFLGFVPRLPPDAAGGLMPRRDAGAIVDPLWAVQGMIATTFSVAGAFYQAYLVREKGWTTAHLRQGLFDSLAGISMLGLITMVIMVTAAAALHGTVNPDSLQSVADVARQLEPLFGTWAKVLFCLGIFAGAFSSFLVNAMIGGAILSDGLGLGASMDQHWPKVFTAGALLVGMAIAIRAACTGSSRVGLIVFAQALTVLGVPVLALSMTYLAARPELTGPRKIPLWMKLLGAAGCIVTLALAARTAWRIYLQATAP